LDGREWAEKCEEDKRGQGKKSVCVRGGGGDSVMCARGGVIVARC